MTQETKDFIKLFLRMSVVGTAIGLPLALGMRHYIPETYQYKTTVMAVGLTAFGLAVKEYYFHRAAHQSPAELLEA